MRPWVGGSLFSIIIGRMFCVCDTPQEEDVDLFLKAGASRVFFKPIPVDEVLNLLLCEVRPRWRAKNGLPI
jgi:hypothetical protein